MYWFAMAVMTKYHRLQGLKQQEFTSSQFRSQEAQEQYVDRSVSSEASLLGSQTPPSSGVFARSSLYTSVSEFPLLIRTPVTLEAHMSSFPLNRLFKGPVSKCSCILRYWRLGLQQ